MEVALKVIVLARDARRHGWSSVVADADDGTTRRVGLGLDASVLQVLDDVAAAIKEGRELPDKVD